MQVRFKLEKETKGALRYQEVDDKGGVIPKIGTLYMYNQKFLVSCLCALLGATTPVKSQNRPSPFLKNVSPVVYSVVAADKGHCTIDLKALNTAIDLVANQSTKPKLINEKEHHERGQELVDKASEAGRKFDAARTDAEMAMAKKAWDEAIEASSKYSAAPSLLLVLDVFELKSGGCVGDVSASVNAMLKQSEMISTGQVISHPHEVIWRSGSLLITPSNLFSREVIETSKDMLKSFVNDWTLSQQK